MASKLPDWIQSARTGWRWNGSERPPFAHQTSADQESVWDYPRPPRLVADKREVTIHWDGLQIARTVRAVRALETSHPPSFYLPWNDISHHLLREVSGSSFCEWKGAARYWSLVDAGRELPRVAWSYPAPLSGAELIADCVAFYPQDLECRVDGALARPQPGGFYGGWITRELSGPFKGDAGSRDW